MPDQSGQGGAAGNGSLLEAAHQGPSRGYFSLLILGELSCQLPKYWRGEFCSAGARGAFAAAAWEIRHLTNPRETAAPEMTEPSSALAFCQQPGPRESPAWRWTRQEAEMQGAGAGENVVWAAQGGFGALLILAHAASPWVAPRQDPREGAQTTLGPSPGLGGGPRGGFAAEHFPSPALGWECPRLGTRGKCLQGAGLVSGARCHPSASAPHSSLCPPSSGAG